MPELAPRSETFLKVVKHESGLSEEERPWSGHRHFVGYLTSGDRALVHEELSADVDQGLIDLLNMRLAFLEQKHQLAKAEGVTSHRSAAPASP